MKRLALIFAWLTLAAQPTIAQTTSVAGGPASSLQSYSAATVATTESTSSTAYTDLTTSGPSVTLTMAGTTAVVCEYAEAQKSAATTGNTAFISVAISGATTLAAADANAAQMAHPYGTSFTGQFTLATCLNLTGLTAGTNTFKLRYRVDGATFSFTNRSITVYAP